MKMPTDKGYLNYVSECLSHLGDVTFRPMMGEYLLYYKGKYTAIICDDRLLVKPTERARALLPNANSEPPYEGAKPMLAVDCPDDGETMELLFNALYDDLPAPKPKKPKK